MQKGQATIGLSIAEVFVTFIEEGDIRLVLGVAQTKSRLLLLV